MFADHTHQSLNCAGVLLDLSHPKLMGVLNVTPDSFSDGGLFMTTDAALAQAQKMLNEGADLLDLGGYSSRPGASDISVEVELARILPPLRAIRAAFPEAILSIDTFRSEVAAACLNEGAGMINDISGGNLDANMMPTVAKYSVPYCLMHNRGTPQTMQSLTNYAHLVQEVYAYFVERVRLARSYNLTDIVLDLGFGFAKTLDQNYELLAQLGDFHTLDCPLVVGVSRKSMLYKLLQTDAQDVLPAASALHFFALQQGAKILRTHDIKAAKQVLSVYQKLTERT